MSQLCGVTDILEGFSVYICRLFSLINFMLASYDIVYFEAMLVALLRRV